MQLGIPIPIGIILANLYITYNGLKSPSFFSKHLFNTERILLFKESRRMLSSGFLHNDWMHFFFNMLALYFFSGTVIYNVGPWLYLLIYFGSLIGGNLIALIVNKNNSSYSAVGASGAVSGIVFSSIVIAPLSWISIYFIPMPAILFGIIYTIYTIYGIKSKKDNIGHEAHLGGGLFGMLLLIFCSQNLGQESYLALAIIALPSFAFLLYIIRKPHVLLLDKSVKKDLYSRAVEYGYNQQKNIQQNEIDEILDKVNKRGINKLSKKDRKKLDDFSQL